MMELRAAIRRNNGAGIKFEIESGAPVNQARKVDGYSTILQEAAENPEVSLETLRILVEAGADHTLAPGELVRKASATGELERVKFFESLGCPLTKVDRYGYTSLHSAIRAGVQPPYDLVEYLLAAGVNINQKSSWSETALGYALSGRRFDMARLLVRHGATGEEGWPKIFGYVLESNLDAIALNKADLGSEFFSFGMWRPLRIAISMGDVSLCEFLLRNGSTVTYIDPRGMDVMSDAILSGSVEMAEWVLKTLLNGELHKQLAPDYRFYSLFSEACQVDSVEMAEWLLKAGENISEMRFGSCSSLEMANFCLLHHEPLAEPNFLESSLVDAAEDSPEFLVEYLLDRGVDPNTSNYYPGNALHQAVKRDSDRLVKMLLDKGCRVDQLDGDGDPPLCVAKSLSVARMLIDAGADPDQEHWVYGTVRRHLLEQDVAFSRIL